MTILHLSKDLLYRNFNYSGPGSKKKTYLNANTDYQTICAPNSTQSQPFSAIETTTVLLDLGLVFLLIAVRRQGGIMNE